MKKKDKPEDESFADLDFMKEGLAAITGRAEIIPVVSKDDEEFLLFERNPLSDEIPFLPLKENVVFPGVVSPILVSRKSSLRLLQRASRTGQSIVVVSQKNDTETPQWNDLFHVGVVGHVLRLMEMPNGSKVAIIQGVQKCRLDTLTQYNPFMMGHATLIDEYATVANLRKFHSRCNDVLHRYAEMQAQRINVSKENAKEMVNMLRNISSDRILVNFICEHIEMSTDNKQRLLESEGYDSRLELLSDILDNTRDFMQVRDDVQDKARKEMERNQREYFLNQQMRVIQNELGENPNEQDIARLESRAEGKLWPASAKAAFAKSIERLRRVPVQTPDYAIELNYAELLLDLPWMKCSKDKLVPSHAQRVLDRDHYGMEKVKERIVEYVSVLKLKGDSNSPILCLVGPPGTGKTSLGKSIADAINRKYVRVALGGLHDEAEIRGHRRTYIGAMPGRIIQSIKKAGVGNPVFVLDEIDKVQNMSHNGDPTSALLEVLDPEQNKAFHDNYLDLDYDLSKVLFVATANSLSGVQPALLDRMEIIDISGYILEEKVEIALRHLVPRQLEEHGFGKKDLKFSKPLLVTLINDYTRESGVRQLEKAIAKIVRRRAVQKVNGDEISAEIRAEELKSILGLPIHNSERRGRESKVGVVTGLAWTQVGGEILFVEACVSKGKGTLTMTGNLGDVMKESATLAFEYLKSNAAAFGVEMDAIENNNVHIHVPEGATPKDGPSAGITMFVAMLSAFTQRRVIPTVAMTGEITLRGLVTPVGGIKEKILAAKRAAITDIVLCEDNRRDIEEIPAQYLSGLTFHYIREMKEALPIAFEQ